MNLLLRSLDYAVQVADNKNPSLSVTDLAVFLTSRDQFYCKLLPEFCSRGYGISFRAARIFLSAPSSTILKELLHSRFTLVLEEHQPLVPPSLLSRIVIFNQKIKQVTVRRSAATLGRSTISNEAEFLAHLATSTDNNSLQQLQLINFSLSVEELSKIVPSTENFEELTLTKTTFVKQKANFSNLMKTLKSKCPNLKKISLNQIEIGGVTDFANLTEHCESFVMTDNFHQESKISMMMMKNEKDDHTKSNFILNPTSCKNLKQLIIVGANFASPLDTSLLPRNNNKNNLTKLILSKCGLEKEINWKLFPTSITHLDLSENKKLTGVVNLSNLLHINKAKYINLRDCGFQGEIIFENANQNESNTTTDPSADTYAALSLEFLDLSNNPQLCFDISAKFLAPKNGGRSFKHLKHLAFSGNRYVFGNLSINNNDGVTVFPDSLENFLADGCSLSGDLDLTQLFPSSSKIRVISISGNHFGGKLNICAPNLKHLHKIDVSGNNFHELIILSSSFLKREMYPPNLRTLFLQGNDFSCSENRIPFPFHLEELPDSLLRFNCSRCNFKQPENCPPGALFATSNLILPPNMKSLQMAHLDFGGGHSKDIQEAKEAEMTKRNSGSKKKSANKTVDFPSPRSSNILDLGSVLPPTMQFFDISSLGLNGTVKISQNTLPEGLSVVKMTNNNFDEKSSEIDDELTIKEFKVDFFESDDDDEDEDDNDGYGDENNGDEFVKYDGVNVIDDDEGMPYDEDDCQDDFVDDENMDDFNDDDDDDEEAKILAKLKKNQVVPKKAKEIEAENFRRIVPDSFASNDVHSDREISDDDNEKYLDQECKEMLLLRSLPLTDDDALQEAMAFARSNLNDLISDELLAKVATLKAFEGIYHHQQKNDGRKGNDDDDDIEENYNDESDGSDDFNF